MRRFASGNKGDTAVAPEPITAPASAPAPIVSVQEVADARFFVNDQITRGILSLSIQEHSQTFWLWGTCTTPASRTRGCAEVWS